MNSVPLNYVRPAAVLGVALGVWIFAVPLASWGQAEQGKSAEEILEGLLGSDRGIGGVRHDLPPDQAQEARIAVPIHFAYNSADIASDSFDQLHRVAAALKDPRLSSARIGVEGHTDKQGSADYNRALSQRRAEAVKRYLVDKEGVPAPRIEARGYGMSRPLSGVSQDTDEGRAAHRRVEFVNLSTVPAKPGGAAAKASGPALSVAVVVTYQKGGESQVLVPGAILTPNDNYRITFTPNRDGYVYVYQVDSKGKADVAFPNPRYATVGNPVKANQKHMIPPEGQWFTLDAVPGDEEIVVLGSESELADAQSIATRMRAQPFGTAMRGPAANPRADVAPETPPGVFTYRLPFKHR